MSTINEKRGIKTLSANKSTKRYIMDIKNQGKSQAYNGAETNFVCLSSPVLSCKIITQGPNSKLSINKKNCNGNACLLHKSYGSLGSSYI